jgi:hypothetical protein
MILAALDLALFIASLCVAGMIGRGARKLEQTRE